ncbi:hypothetical protein SLA2020_475300 [Shorea laevis]
MTWLSDKATRAGFATRNLFRHHPSHSNLHPPTLGILAFETAKAMSRLVALYHSLSDEEFLKLRRGPMKSQGVALLNSKDDSFLLNLACAEKLEDLNQAARTIARLGKKCTNAELNNFDTTYENMKQGIVNWTGTEFKSRIVEKMIERMEKYVNTTSILHASMVALNELEASEKKIKKLKKNGNPTKPQKTNLDYFNEKIAFQRKQVRFYREISLWNQTFDKCVELMARIVGVVFVRICVVFCPFVPSLPCISKKKVVDQRFRQHISNPKPIPITVHPEADYCLLEDRKKHLNRKTRSGPIPMRVHPEANYCLLEDRKKHLNGGTRSGPIPRILRKQVAGPTRFHSGKLIKREEKGLGFRIATVTTNNGIPQNPGSSGSSHNIKDTNRLLLQSPPPNTVGDAGLSVRYANVIIMAERYFNVPASINNEARTYMYELLPASLKQTVRGKLKSHWYKDAEEREGEGLAQGWKEAVEEIMTWLAPVAHDTVKWQQERNLEKQRFDAKPTVLLLQTLHFSDLEKTEAAIVEVLVGLSYIYRYENR